MAKDVFIGVDYNDNTPCNNSHYKHRPTVYLHGELNSLNGYDITCYEHIITNGIHRVEAIVKGKTFDSRAYIWTDKYGMTKGLVVAADDYPSRQDAADKYAEKAVVI